MANLTIENLGGMVQNGNVGRVMEQGSLVEGPLAPQAPEIGGVEAPASGKSFGQVMNEQLMKVNDLQVTADRAAEELAAGRNKNIHETMLIMEQADMSFRLAMQVRNKIIDAYREIMRMQV